MAEVRPGLTAEKTLRVTGEHTAEAAGSGIAPVLSTPHMAALMEGAAVAAADKLLEAGRMTVGVALNIRHLAATSVGRTVTAKAEVTAVEGRRIVFAVEARCGDEIIGQGVHERAVVDYDRFMARLNGSPAEGK